MGISTLENGKLKAESNALEVVAALIEKGQRLLICKRPEGKARAAQWEFPGGKIEPGESAEQAIIRECREELALTLDVKGVFTDLIYHYPELTIHLTLLRAEIAEGEPQNLEHSELRWITPNEAKDYDFCPADSILMERIILHSEQSMVGSTHCETPDALSDAKPSETHEVNAIRERLLSMSDPAYGDFVAKLTPSVERGRIMGIRTPLLRSYARELAKTPESRAFLSALPHEYYEENHLHGFIIERMTDFNEAISAIEAFLPYIDNWATCDSVSPKVFAKHLTELMEHIKLWLASTHTYTIRFGIGKLMGFYLNSAFDPSVLDLVSSVSSGEYYVNMMIAWFFATALAKQYDATLPYMENRRLEAWTHNKAIQKSVESRRLTQEQKEYLRTLRVK